MLRLRHDIGNDIPPTMFSSGLSLLSFGDTKRPSLGLL
jgi:hypothetical protein